MAKIIVTVKQFLKVFQKQMLAFTPHKNHHHWQNTEIAKLIQKDGMYMKEYTAASFFDYSQNRKLMTAQLLQPKAMATYVRFLFVK